MPVRLPACLCETSSSTVKSPGAAGRSRITSSISCGSMAATSCQLPLEDRRGLLADLPLLAPLQRVESLEDSKPWDRACAEGWEGVIAKRRGSVYEHRRSPHWLKMKCELAQELVVGGFTDPQGGRVGLGALLVGYFEDHEFVFAGKVGTGFDTKLLLDLRARLDAPRDAENAIHEGRRPSTPARTLGAARDRRPGCLHRVDGARQAASLASARPSHGQGRSRRGEGRVIAA